MASNYESIAPIRTRKHSLKNVRHEYEGRILLSTVSSVLLSSTIITGLLSKIEYVIQGWIDSIKGISNSINYLEDPLQ